MTNVILGSGLIGLLARYILGPTWKVIPFYRSRFFSFNPALDDNFLIRHAELDELVKEFSTDNRVLFYRRSWSIGGHLVPKFDAGLCADWMAKLFDRRVPQQASLYFQNQMVMPIYDLRLHELYVRLVTQFMPEIDEERKKGIPTEIGDHYIIRNGVKEEFAKAVSTIPLQALCLLLKSTLKFPTRTMHYMHVETGELDFEGANQTLVVDPLFDFVKVTNIAPNRYLFYMQNAVENPGLYMMQFMRKFDILEGTSIEGVVPVGPSPKLDNLDKQDIFCVGSNAQHDWCMDVSSCMLRLLRYAGRSARPAQPIPVGPGDIA